MAVQTDQDVMGEIQDHLLEPFDAGLTWPSGLWTLAQVINAVQDAQNEFLRDTGVFLTPAVVVILGHTHRGSLPQDWIITQDVMWHGADGKITEVPRSDDVQADNAQADWELNAVPVPLMYTDASQPTLQIQVMPAPALPGQLEILYVALGAVLTGLGVQLTAPDNCTPAIKWRAIGILLETLGRAQDAEGASYCRQRYQEGVAGVDALLKGWAGF